MASVKKLVLVPAEEWERILKVSGEEAGTVATRQIEIPVPHQRGSGSAAVEERPDAENEHTRSSVGSPPPPPPSSHPSQPSPEEVRARGPEEAGNGKERKEGGDVGRSQAEKYVPREDTGRASSDAEMRRNGGVWNPPGRQDGGPPKRTTWISL